MIPTYPMSYHRRLITGLLCQDEADVKVVCTVHFTQIPCRYCCFSRTTWHV